MLPPAPPGTSNAPPAGVAAEAAVAPPSAKVTRVAPDSIPPATLYPTTTYTCKPGDTLQGIAIKHKLRVNELKRLNRLYTSDAHVYVGQVLTVRALDAKGKPLPNKPPPLQNVTKENKAAASGAGISAVGKQVPDNYSSRDKPDQKKGYGVAMPGTNIIVSARSSASTSSQSMDASARKESGGSSSGAEDINDEGGTNAPSSVAAVSFFAGLRQTLSPFLRQTAAASSSSSTVESSLADGQTSRKGRAAAFFEDMAKEGSSFFSHPFRRSSPESVQGNVAMNRADGVDSGVEAPDTSPSALSSSHRENTVSRGNIGHSGISDLKAKVNDQDVFWPEGSIERSPTDTEDENATATKNARKKVMRKLPELLGRSDILTPTRIEQLEAILPLSTQGYRWRLLYSTTQHGGNIGTFYTRARREKRTLLLVDTLCNEVFGGFTSTEWNFHDKTNTRRNQYFGTGESFLFMFPRQATSRRRKKKQAKRMNNRSEKETESPEEAASVQIKRSFPRNNSRKEVGQCDRMRQALTERSNLGDEEKTDGCMEVVPSDMEACDRSSPQEKRGESCTDDQIEGVEEASSSSVGRDIGEVAVENNEVDEGDVNAEVQQRTGIEGRESTTHLTAVGETEEKDYDGEKGEEFNCDLEEVRYFPWTASNNLVMMATDTYIALGGGGGSFGLYLDDDFSRGTTGACETYANAPLCSQEDFEVSTIELWGFGV